MTVYLPWPGQCHATVTPGPHYLHTFNCQNHAKTERDGRKVCRVHAKAKQVHFAPDPKEEPAK